MESLAIAVKKFLITALFRHQGVLHTASACLIEH
jgi:hypothetical protein